MERINLEQRLMQIFENISKGIIDDNVYSYNDYKNKYVHLKPEVSVEVKFTDGKEAKIDITDWFKEVVK